jgi:hypothetical protein
MRRIRKLQSRMMMPSGRIQAKKKSLQPIGIEAAFELDALFLRAV